MIEAPIILAFDYGKKNTGWAVLKGCDLIGYGLWQFETMTYPQMGASFYASVVDLFHEVERTHGTPTHFAWENAFKQQGHAAEVFKFCSVMGAMAAYDCNLTAMPVYSGTIKKVVTGVGSAEKAEVVKNINLMYGLDLNPDDKTSPDHNAADAIGVGLVAYYKATGDEEGFSSRIVRRKPTRRRLKRRKRTRYTKRAMRNKLEMMTELGFKE